MANPQEEECLEVPLPRNLFSLEDWPLRHLYHTLGTFFEGEPVPSSVHSRFSFADLCAKLGVRGLALHRSYDFGGPYRNIQGFLRFMLATLGEDMDGSRYDNQDTFLRHLEMLETLVFVDTQFNRSETAIRMRVDSVLLHVTCMVSSMRGPEGRLRLLCNHAIEARQFAGATPIRSNADYCIFDPTQNWAVICETKSMSSALNGDQRLQLFAYFRLMCRYPCWMTRNAMLILTNSEMWDITVIVSVGRTYRCFTVHGIISTELQLGDVVNFIARLLSLSGIDACEILEQPENWKKQDATAELYDLDVTLPMLFEGVSIR